MVALEPAPSDDYTRPLQLAAPLQWQMLPEGTVSGPQELHEPARALAFKDLADDTILPTMRGQAVWLRFTLPVTAMAQTWYLRIPRLRLEQVTLFYLGENNRWSAQAAGLNIPVVQWPVPTRLPSFQLSTRSDRPQTYFIKLQNRTPIAEHPEFISPVEYIVAASLTGGQVGLMLGLFGLLTLLSLLTAHLYRNSHFAWFALFVVSLLGTQLILIGFAGQRIWPRSSYLNQIMFWVGSLWALAACLWFILQVSYAKQAFPRIYRISCGTIALLILCSGIVAVWYEHFPRNGLTLISALAILWSLGCLVWMAWRAQRWLWVIAAGFAPLALAMATRLAYNFGWVARVEVAQLWSVIVGIIGMMVIYAGLIMRNRDTFAAMQRAAALTHTDIATGLSAGHIATLGLPRMMARSARSGQTCGVVMLRWVDFQRQVASLPEAQKNLVQIQFGARLRRLSRYIDTVARLDDEHFLFIVEAPVSADYINALGTKILTTCMRPVAQFKNGASFDVHIALWVSTDKPMDAELVLAALRTRLQQMDLGTRRRVQFVNSSLNQPLSDSLTKENMHASLGGATGPQAVLDKIDAIERDSMLPKIFTKL